VAAGFQFVDEPLSEDIIPFLNFDLHFERCIEVSFRLESSEFPMTTGFPTRVRVGQ
jgi:hypothetical protein